ncbi:MAG TPA: hypothetical protein VFP86_22015 [bacterium]|nr:hypothetical protein [bacterium]
MSAAAPAGDDLLICGGRVLDPADGVDGPADLAIRQGRIRAVGSIASAAAQVVDATGLVVSPGWIDLHAHVAYGLTRGSVHPDGDAGVAKGVTTVVDTGTCGAASYEAFSAYIIQRATTRVLAFLNVSVPGLTVSP